MGMLLRRYYQPPVEAPKVEETPKPPAEKAPIKNEKKSKVK